MGEMLQCHCLLLTFWKLWWAKTLAFMDQVFSLRGSYLLDSWGFHVCILTYELLTMSQRVTCEWEQNGNSKTWKELHILSVAKPAQLREKGKGSSPWLWSAWQPGRVRRHCLVLFILLSLPPHFLPNLVNWGNSRVPFLLNSLHNFIWVDLS